MLGRNPPSSLADDEATPQHRHVGPPCTAPVSPRADPRNLGRRDRVNTSNFHRHGNISEI